MIGLDTNVLIRLLTDDDPGQAQVAARFVQDAVARKQLLHINLIVFTEVAWVLQRRYGFGREGLLGILAQVLDNPRYDIGHRWVVEAACRLFAESKAGFSDCVIAVMNGKLGCQQTATFDRAAAALPGTKLLNPLS